MSASDEGVWIAVARALYAATRDISAVLQLRLVCRRAAAAAFLDGTECIGCVRHLLDEWVMQERCHIATSACPVCVLVCACMYECATKRSRQLGDASCTRRTKLMANTWEERAEYVFRNKMPRKWFGTPPLDNAVYHGYCTKVASYELFDKCRGTKAWLPSDLSSLIATHAMYDDRHELVRYLYGLYDSKPLKKSRSYAVIQIANGALSGDASENFRFLLERYRQDCDDDNHKYVVRMFATLSHPMPMLYYHKFWPRVCNLSPCRTLYITVPGLAPVAQQYLPSCRTYRCASLLIDFVLGTSSLFQECKLWKQAPSVVAMLPHDVRRSIGMRRLFRNGHRYDDLPGEVSFHIGWIAKRFLNLWRYGCVAEARKFVAGQLCMTLMYNPIETFFMSWSGKHLYYIEALWRELMLVTYHRLRPPYIEYTLSDMMLPIDGCVRMMVRDPLVFSFFLRHRHDKRQCRDWSTEPKVVTMLALDTSPNLFVSIRSSDEYMSLLDMCVCVHVSNFMGCITEQRKYNIREQVHNILQSVVEAGIDARQIVRCARLDNSDCWEEIKSAIPSSLA